MREAVTAGEIGFKPLALLALVSDQSASFQAALTSSQEDTHRFQILAKQNYR